MRPRRPAVALVAASLSAAPLSGCAEEPPACVVVAPDCAPLYPPTFANVYAMTLAPHCGAGRGACHSEAGRAGGLSFATEAGAFAALTDAARPRVVAGDPGCSAMIVRTEEVGAAWQMPPGDALPPAERCALARWVAAGAPGPVAARAARPAVGRRP